VATRDLDDNGNTGFLPARPRNPTAQRTELIVSQTPGFRQEQPTIQPALSSSEAFPRHRSNCSFTGTPITWPQSRSLQIDRGVLDPIRRRDSRPRFLPTTAGFDRSERNRRSRSPATSSTDNSCSVRGNDIDPVRVSTLAIRERSIISTIAQAARFVRARSTRCLRLNKIENGVPRENRRNERLL